MLRFLFRSFLILLILSSCASFKDKEYATVKEYGSSYPLRKTFSYEVLFSHSGFDGKPFEINYKKKLQKKIYATLDESGFFKKLIPESRRREHIKLDFKIRRSFEGEERVWYSAGLWPFSDNIEITLDATFYPKRGRKEEFQYKDSITLYYHLLLSPLWPFFRPDNVEAEVQANLVKVFLNQLYKKGLISD